MKRLALAVAVLAAACGSTETPNETSNTARAASLRLTQMGPALQGEPVLFAIAALDAAGEVDASYRGTLRLSSDDASAAVPALTLSAEHAGERTVSVVFSSAGEHKLAVLDTHKEDLGGEGFAEVKNKGTTALFLTQLPSSTVAGKVLLGQVLAMSRENKVDKDFEGTVHFTSNDPNATLPDDITFTRDDKGVRVFPFRLTTAGARSITASQVGGPASPSTARGNVSAAAASRISLEGLA